MSEAMRKYTGSARSVCNDVQQANDDKIQKDEDGEEKTHPVIIITLSISISSI
jgi:hypothetical protein